MTDQEKINTEIQMKLELQDAKFNAFMQEMRDFKKEMRDRDKQRAEDIRNRDKQRAEDIREIRNSIQNLRLSEPNLNVVTILAIAVIVIAVLLK